MTEEELQKELDRLLDIEEKQSEILKKQTGKGLYEEIDITDDGTIIIDSDDEKQKKIWNVE